MPGAAGGGAQAITVYLADDNLIVRAGVQALLSREPDIAVVGTAADYDELVAGAGACGSQVVVTDIRMPPAFRREGINAAHEIRKRHPGTGIVVLSQFDEPEYAISDRGRGHRPLPVLARDRGGRLLLLHGGAAERGQTRGRRRGCYGQGLGRRRAPVLRGLGHRGSTRQVRRAKGAGFVNMGDRVGAVGGTLKVDSTVGRGTTISGRVPIVPPAGAPVPTFHSHADVSGSTS